MHLEIPCKQLNMSENINCAGKIILVVEDDSISRTLYREIFKTTGAQVDFVKSGSEAFDYIARNTLPDLILMDIRLPDINGLEITRQLLQQHPGLNIVAQTAFANSNMEDECMNIGMKGFITKPIQRTTIMRLLQDMGW